MNSIVKNFKYRQILKELIVTVLVAIIPVLIAMSFMNLWHWDLSIPLDYRDKNSDETWQLILTKMVADTGWILNNPFLGAPGTANWHNNPAAQTSALHSVLMLAISKLMFDPIKVQQFYYLLNFALISLTSFFSCRLLGLARLPAFCIAILFSLLGYRFNFFIYSFLSNYFTVPLALTAVFWIMTGEFSKYFFPQSKSILETIKETLSQSKFFLGLFYIALIAISDGYYAFFTLLLIGFATIVRALSGDIIKPASLLVPIIYIATLITVALLLASPLRAYKNSHPDEFAPNGVQDPALTKHSFEAEIYSVSLKLLIAPTPNHRIESFASLGKKITETSDAARQYKTGPIFAPLGILGSFLLATALTLLAVPALRTKVNNISLNKNYKHEVELLWAAIALALFIFLCSISGGIGTLIALVYPTIRAYDRFPLFLIFVLYVGAGAALTIAIRRTQDRNRLYLTLVTLLVANFSLYDQLPNNIDKGSKDIRDRFLSEKKFVKTIEEKIESGAMVYQYPYSQWLTNSDYYGWGSFAHVRLYLHSTTLRWSNGASKNSPVDDWHLRLSRLPVEQLLIEVRAAGFSSVVVDRSVVSPIEYQHVKNALMNYTHVAPIEDDTSKLTFFKFYDPGYMIFYDETYKDAIKIVISDKAKTLTSALPRIINKVSLNKIIETHRENSALIIERAAHPEVFFKEAKFTRGVGDQPVFPISEISSMKGKINCAINQSNLEGAIIDNTIVMTIANDTDFDWKFNQGNFPLRIGVHLRSLDGKIMKWDDGWRLITDVPGNMAGKVTRTEALTIQQGETRELRFPLSQLNLKSLGAEKQNLIADFNMVQDGHAWFENLSCKIVVNN